MDIQSRRALAMVLAPLVVPIAVAVRLHEGGLSDTWLTVALVASMLFSYFGFFALGIPAELILRKKGITHFGAAMLLGAVAGGITWLLFAMLFALLLGEGGAGVKLVFTDVNSMLDGQVSGGGLGSLVGLVYWLLARPDKTNFPSGI